MTSTNTYSIVTVIEPNGVLEEQVLLMAESLRRYGGRFSSCPILCVSPRLRPPLRRSTLRRFEELNITHIYKIYNRKYSWYGFYNKPLAILTAREETDSTHLIWLDADVLVLDEPRAFVGADGVDFLACPATKDVATSGPMDRFDVYWEALCRSVGLNLEDLPWVITGMESLRVRYYMNSGVFLVRRNARVIEQYLKTFDTLLDDGIRSSTDGIFVLEQIALSLAVLTSGANWKCLPYSHNFMITGRPEVDRVDGLETACIVHYHQALIHDRRDVFLGYLRERRPDRSEWVNDIKPLNYADAPLSQRFLRKALSSLRGRRERKFLASCRVIDTSLRAPLPDDPAFTP